MTIDEETLEYIVDRMVELAHPDRVILFGSAATGEMTPDSDLDLLVVESHVANTRRESMRLRAALEDVPFPVDVIVMSRERRGDEERYRRHCLPGAQIRQGPL